MKYYYVEQLDVIDFMLIPKNKTPLHKIGYKKNNNFYSDLKLEMVKNFTSVFIFQEKQDKLIFYKEKNKEVYDLTILWKKELEKDGFLVEINHDKVFIIFDKETIKKYSKKIIESKK